MHHTFYIFMGMISYFFLITSPIIIIIVNEIRYMKKQMEHHNRTIKDTHNKVKKNEDFNFHLLKYLKDKEDFDNKE